MENNSPNIQLSIIVTFIKKNYYLKKFLKCYLLKNKKFFDRCELILISESLFLSSYLNLKNIRFIKTKFKTPGAKRNYAAFYARGNYLIFLDDDSYVSEKYFTFNDLKLLIKFWDSGCSCWWLRLVFIH